jgi:hypothetical protein
MSENGWSIALGENRVFLSRYGHLTGLLVDPRGNFVESIELQPNFFTGEVVIGPRTGNIDAVHSIVSDLTEQQAKEMYAVIADSATVMMQSTGYEVPPSHWSHVPTLSGLIAMGTGATLAPEHIQDLMSDISGINDSSITNSDAFGRMFHDSAIGESGRRGLGTVTPKNQDDFENPVPGFGILDKREIANPSEFGFVNADGFIDAPGGTRDSKGKFEDDQQRFFSQYQHELADRALNNPDGPDAQYSKAINPHSPSNPTFLAI